MQLPQHHVKLQYKAYEIKHTGGSDQKAAFGNKGARDIPHVVVLFRAGSNSSAHDSEAATFTGNPEEPMSTYSTYAVQEKSDSTATAQIMFLLKNPVIF